MRAILRLLIVLAVPIVLTMVVVRALTLPWYPAFEYARPGFPQDSFGLTQQERLSLAQASIRFLNVPGHTELLTDLRLPNGEPAYNEREFSHMVDVKRVFSRLTLLAGAMLLVAVIAAAVLARLDDRCGIWDAIAEGGGLTLAVLLTLGVWMLTGFDQFFTFFHGLFFQPGTWTFSYSDTLIRLFPLPFWQDAGLIVAGAVSLCSLLLLGVGIWRGRGCRQQRKTVTQ